MLQAACAAPPQHVYVLGADTQIAIGTTSQDGTPRIEFMTVSVPDYLDTTDIMRRTGPNEVTPSPTGQWGERLSVGVTDALAARLNHLQSGAVITREEPALPTRQLLVQLQRFEITTDGSCNLVARWQVLAANHRTTLASEQGSFSAKAATQGDAAAAAAMTQALDALARDIAATLSGIPAPARKAVLF
jgi:uncharacterized lipoprotein YmbA